MVIKPHFLRPLEFSLLAKAMVNCTPYVQQDESYYTRGLCKLPSEMKAQLTVEITRFVEESCPTFSRDTMELEFLRAARYPKGCYFAPHVDTKRLQDNISIPSRLLSFSFIIQKASRGGLFRTEDEIPCNEPNTLLVFSSSTVHEVTEVVEGERIVAFGFFRTIEKRPTHNHAGLVE